jgi:hypothetical protein
MPGLISFPTCTASAVMPSAARASSTLRVWSWIRVATSGADSPAQAFGIVCAPGSVQRSE